MRKTILVMSFLVCALFCGCASQKLYEQNLIANYPLADFSEVIETNRDVLSLLNDTRSYLLDNYTNSANLLGTSSTSNMITLSVYSSFDWVSTALPADLSYTIVAEFRDGRMRFSSKDVEVACYNGYNQKFIIRDQSGWKGAGYKTLRKKGSALYQQQLEDLKTAFHKIAEGKLESNW